ncbi:GntR family transcriptional regulator [Chromatiales bacterium (ex Bugula neritina AB1)]|nr:GntR family transcriptional regulator [Chromatiales bacterium (ex Bugula neritina AB1)]
MQPGADETATTSTTQRVAIVLRQLLITGEINPGERLKVESLKARLNVGASPIREALSLLTSDQLVERIDQRGFRAAPISEANFSEILTLRCKLEAMALRSSIERGQTHWEEQLVLSHHRLAQAERSNIKEWEIQHKAYHRSLIDACDSPILLRFCDQLYDLNIRYRYLALKSKIYKKRNVSDEHQRIMEAAVARDADTASRLLEEHYRSTGDYLAGQMAAFAE